MQQIPNKASISKEGDKNIIQQITNRASISKEGDNNILLNIYSGYEKNSNIKYMNIKINNLINTYNNNNDKSLQGYSEKGIQKELIISKKKYRKRNQLKIKKSKFKDSDKDKEKYKKMDKKSSNNINIEYNGGDKRHIQKQNFNIFTYIWYNMRCRRNNLNILYYEDYREKILSEENIIRGYLDISNLLKLNKLELEDNISITKKIL